MWLIYNWNNHSHYKPVLIGPSFSLCFNSKNRAKKLLRLNEKSPKSNYLQGEVPGRHPPCTFETLNFQTKKHSWRSGGMSEFDRIMALNLLLSKTPPRSSLGGSQSPTPHTGQNTAPSAAPRSPTSTGWAQALGLPPLGAAFCCCSPQHSQEGLTERILSRWKHYTSPHLFQKEILNIYPALFVLFTWEYIKSK